MAVRGSWVRVLGLLTVLVLLAGTGLPRGVFAEEPADPGLLRPGDPRPEIIHPDLRAQIERAEVAIAVADQQVTALVWLSVAPDLQAIKFNTSAVVAALQETAAASQSPILRYIEAEGGEVLNTFWIANLILMRGTPQLIGELTGFEAVAQILPNFTVSAPEPAPAAAAVPPTAVTWGLERIRAPGAWGMGIRGEGALVAVLDTGVAITHPDLAGKMATDNPADPHFPGGWMEFDGAGNRVSSFPHDTSTHGTHVTGTVLGGAAGGTAIGVAPAARHMHGLVIPGGGGTFAQVAAGMQWAIAPVDRFGNPAGRPADIVNMSLGATGHHSVMITPVRNLFFAGIFPAISIGNAGDGLTGSPGNVFEAVGVGATDINDNVATWSSGAVVSRTAWIDPPPEWPDTWVKPDISAPGVDVLSAHPGGGYFTGSGTSMAAPHVAGTVALMLSADPTLTVTEVLGVLRETSFWDDRHGPARPNTRFGWGRIDALAAVELVALDSGIRGTVTAAGTGLPLPGVRVEAGGRKVLTGLDGRYEIRLAPATYDVQFSRWGYVTEVVPGVAVAEGQFTAVDADLAIGPRGTLAGVVNFTSGGVTHPVPGMTVETVGAPERILALTDAQGQYAMTLPPGEYTLRVSGQGLPEAIATAVVEADVQVILNFTLVAKGRVALLGDTAALDWLNWLRADGWDATLRTFANLGDVAEWGAIIYNRPGAWTSPAFHAFLAATQAAGTGVIFLDTWSTAGNGIWALWTYTRNPTGRGTGWSSAIPNMFYRVVAEHPVLAGHMVGEDILHDPGSADHDHAWFTGFTGEGVQILAEVYDPRPGIGVRGHGIAVRQTPGNRHVLLSMHGSSLWSRPGWMSPASLQIMRNALTWAGRPVEGPRFAFWDLAISPEETLHGRPVNISVSVKNIGNLAGPHVVELLLNDVAVDSQTVTLESGQATQVSFTLTAPVALGIHRVRVAHLHGTFRVRPPRVTVEAQTMIREPIPGRGGRPGTPGLPPQPLAGAHVLLVRGGAVIDRGMTDAAGRLVFEAITSIDQFTVVLLHPEAADGRAYLLTRAVMVDDDIALSFVPVPATHVAAEIDFTPVHRRHTAWTFLASADTLPFGFGFRPGRVVIAKQPTMIVSRTTIDNLDSVWDYLTTVETFNVGDGFEYELGGRLSVILADIRGQAAPNITLDWAVRDAGGRTLQSIAQTAVIPFGQAAGPLRLEPRWLSLELPLTAEGTLHRPLLRLFEPAGRDEPYGRDVRAGSVEWGQRPFPFVIDPGTVLPGSYTLRMTADSGPYSGVVAGRSSMVLPARSTDAVRVRRGGEVEITVKFDAPTTAPSVTLREILPAGFSVVRWKSSPPVVGRDYDGHAGWTWNRTGTSRFSPGETIEVTYRVRVAATVEPGPYPLSGTVTDAQHGARVVAGPGVIVVDP
ncbi:MAG TPA: S8 family serine peptidase [Bacillota bacterium]|nr:S8 family serine peptidase [Bacillota bacterium]